MVGGEILCARGTGALPRIYGGPALAAPVEVSGRQNGPRDKRFFIVSRVLAVVHATPICSACGFRLRVHSGITLQMITALW